MKNSFSYKNDLGETITFDILVTFKDDDTNKNYIIYTDNTRNKNGDINVYAAGYNPDSPTLELLEVNEFEHKMLKTVIDEIQKELKK